MNNNLKTNNVQTSQNEISAFTEINHKPEWFKWAMGQEASSHIIDVDGCPIHYLLWKKRGPANESKGGILFVHGGAAHAHWWTFLAPFFVSSYKVAALDLSGMGDSGKREEYSAEIRASEIDAVIQDAKLGAAPFIIGHSFGGLISTKYAQKFGEKIGGLIIVDSPIRPPKNTNTRKPIQRRGKRYYIDFKSAVDRFRLLPDQECQNNFLVEHIADRSVKQTPKGWTWKFDEIAMHSRRFKEPYHIYLANIKSRVALIYGENSSLLDKKTVKFMKKLMPNDSPIVAIPNAQHHLTLDQPMAFIAVVRLILRQWSYLNAENFQV